MHILEPFITVLVFVLSGFLAASAWLAGHVERTIDRFATEPEAVEEVLENEPAHEQEPNEAEHTFTKLPTRYEFGGSIPRILVENAAYQKATVFGSVATGTRSEIGTSSATLPERIASALVNLYCTLDSEGKRRATTGSGVFIDDRGVILTNAHVAQFLLLEEASDNADVRCIIRSGNPAEPRYEAELLYLPPAWILENAELIDAKKAEGTGERDYALLYVSDTLDQDTSLPTNFPALGTDASLVSRELKNTDTYVGGYPAEIILVDGPDAALVPKVADAPLTDFYTFGSGYADLVTVSDSEVGEHGSSGGPLVNDRGEVVGLIVTKGDVEDGAKSLRALTLSYISRTIEEETGFDLASTLTGDLAYRGEIFKEALAPHLSNRLNSALD